MTWIRTLCIACCLGLASPAWAVTVTLRQFGDTIPVSDLTLQIGSRRPVLSGFNPEVIPFVESDSITVGEATASASYDLSDEGFAITFAHARGVSPGEIFAEGSGRIFFRVDGDVDFVASGSFAAIDPEGRTVSLSATLRDLETGAELFRSVQSSLSTPNEAFVLGGSGGDNLSIASGSLTGTLIAGNEYSISYITNLSAEGPTSPSQAATGTGSITLAFVPEPSTALLLGAGLLALGTRRRSGGTG